LDWDKFSISFAKILDRRPTGREISQVSSYLSLLLRWNRFHSLTGYRQPEVIVDRLFLDSLLFLHYLPDPDPSPAAVRVLDLGSGAGIPGIPLKIVRPEYEVTLVEARRKRASFLSAVVRELELHGVSVLTGRAESLLDDIPGLKGGFDVVVTRAAGRPKAVLHAALAFLKPGGRFVASGRPLKDPSPITVPGGCWQALVSPASGRQRQFLIVPKIS